MIESVLAAQPARAADRPSRSLRAAADAPRWVALSSQIP